MDLVVQFLFIVAGLLVLGALGEFIFSRTAIPDILWLVAAGILMGPVFQVVPAELLETGLPYFGPVALVTILLGAGMSLELAEVRQAAPRGLTLGLIGFAVAVAGTCLFFLVATALGYVRPFGWLEWIMVGAILGGTSSVVIIPTLAASKVDRGVTRLLVVESCATDALCVVVAMVMIDLVLKGTVTLDYPVMALAREIGFGIIMGIIGGALLAPLLRLLNGQPHGYAVILAWFFAVYGLAQIAGGSGALAVLIGSLLVGNLRTLLKSTRFSHIDFTNHPSTVTVHDHITFFVKSFFFFLIGLMFPTDPRLIILGAVLAVVLLVARFPAAAFSLRGTSFSASERGMIAIATPRGLAAGVLATLPLHYGIPNMEYLVPGVFATIVASILIFSLGFTIMSRRASK